jgi:hypothetical protein
VAELSKRCTELASTLFTYRLQVSLGPESCPTFAVEGTRKDGLSSIRSAFTTSDRRSLVGASLAAETDGIAGEESRLKAGCSQDWLPHKEQRTIKVLIDKAGSLVLC